jgi:hypothetical protein
MDVPFLLPELLITMRATNNKEASRGEVSLPALHHARFRACPCLPAGRGRQGRDDVTLFIGFLPEKIGKRFLK